MIAQHETPRGDMQEGIAVVQHLRRERRGGKRDQRRRQGDGRASIDGIGSLLAASRIAQTNEGMIDRALWAAHAVLQESFAAVFARMLNKWRKLSTTAPHDSGFRAAAGHIHIA